MKISELIHQLDDIRATHGDLNVHLLDGFASWCLPPLAAARYTTDLVPGMRTLGGEQSLVRFNEVRVTGEFAPQWRSHVREAGFYDAVVLTEQARSAADGQF